MGAGRVTLASVDILGGAGSLLMSHYQLRAAIGDFVGTLIVVQSNTSRATLTVCLYFACKNRYDESYTHVEQFFVEYDRFT